MLVDPENALRQYVLSRPEVTALIAQRWHWKTIPQKGILPAVSCRRIGNSRMSEVPVGFLLVQLTVWGTTRTEARTVADTILWELDRHKGVHHGVTFKRMNRANDLELVDPETGRHTVPIDLRITHLEEV